MLALASCAIMGPVGPQIPGRRGLQIALKRFETVARWRNWPYLLEVFYLPDHSEEVKRRYGDDAGRWFRSDRAGAALTGGDWGDARYLCTLAMREKHVSSRFDPHFVVYYRVQREPCRGRLGAPTEALAEGQMEWGYEVDLRRWVHLRPLEGGESNREPS